VSQNMEILALVPARLGSKRIPRKNIRELWGKPLLAYSIEAALRSQMIDRVVCTTDDADIAAIAKEYGAEVPFLRPKELATDKSADTEFYLHAISWLREKESYVPDIIVNLSPSNPLRRVEIVDDALNALAARNSVDSIRTVSRSPYSLFKMRTINPQSGFIECPVNVPREGPYQTAIQPLPESFMVNAYLFATWTEAVLRTRNSLGQKVLPYILDEIPIDLDTEEDWKELIAKYRSFKEYLKENE